MQWVVHTWERGLLVKVGVDFQLIIVKRHDMCIKQYCVMTFYVYLNINTACDFTGQMIDGPNNGPAPGPWDLQCTPPAKFKNHKAEIEVPHTASVKVQN